MAAIATSAAQRRDWRAIVFRVVAGLVALFFVLLNGGFVAVSPWFIPNGPGEEVARMELHRWHSAEWGALTGILFAGSALALLSRPRAKPLLIQFVVVSTIIYMVVFALGISDVYLSDLALFGTIIGVLVVAYPAPRDLLSFSREGSISRPLVAFTLLAAALLAPITWQNLQLHLTGAGGEHATMNHWLDAVLLALVLVTGGLLAASRRPGWQALGVIVGIAFTYLGMAALTLPGYDGSWGAVGGAVSLLGGVLFITATLWESRRMRTHSLITEAGTL